MKCMWWGKWWVNHKNLLTFNVFFQETAKWFDFIFLHFLNKQMFPRTHRFRQFQAFIGNNKQWFEQLIQFSTVIINCNFVFTTLSAAQTEAVTLEVRTVSAHKALSNNSLKKYTQKWQAIGVDKGSMSSRIKAEQKRLIAPLMIAISVLD